MTQTVGILIFNDAEVLDFAGPFEVFSVAGRRGGADPFEVRLIAQKADVTARGNFQVWAHHTLENAPPLDLLVVPGGGGYRADGTPYGSRLEKTNETVLAWLRARSGEAEHVLSVCSGALLLARAGLTRGLRVTTHHRALAELAQDAPDAELCPLERVVDNGRFVFTGGISAGIDGAFHLLERLRGREAALETARYMEYDWRG